MKVILEDSEVQELLIEDSIKSNDLGIVIKPELRGQTLPELQREIIGRDALEVGPSQAARIHGVTAQSASKYANGEDLGNSEARTRILDARNDIRDLATTKLLEALNIIDIGSIEKVTDQVRAASHLSQIVERMEGKNEKGQSVHLHLYAPTQKKVGQYEVIDV
jgi:hypothetical protein